MFTLLIFLSGIILGLTLSLLSLYLLQIKCPNCKQLRPVKEIIFVQWKAKTITGQPCLKCRQTKPQIDISL